LLLETPQPGVEGLELELENFAGLGFAVEDIEGAEGEADKGTEADEEDNGDQSFMTVMSRRGMALPLLQRRQEQNVVHLDRVRGSFAIQKKRLGQRRTFVVFGQHKYAGALFCFSVSYVVFVLIVSWLLIIVCSLPLSLRLHS
jgi:hypothetical protein